MVPKGPASTENLRPQIAFVFWGTFALGFGSALLLPGPLVWRFGGGTDAFVLRIPAVVTHVVGWMFLLASLKAFPLDSAPFGRRLLDRLFVIWMFWFVAALVGIGTLPLVFPELYCTIICVPLGWRLLPYFPFVPSVFAPVVVGHAIFFRLESRMLGPPCRPDREESGSAPRRPGAHIDRDSGGGPVLRLGVSARGPHGARILPCGDWLQSSAARGVVPHRDLGRRGAP